MFQSLETKYSSFVQTEEVILEYEKVKKIKSQFCTLRVLQFAGILAAEYDDSIPIISKLADIYVCHSAKTAHVERKYSIFGAKLGHVKT